MEYAELVGALEAGRAGLFSPSAREEAIPLRGSEGQFCRIALRRGSQIFAVLETTWTQTVAMAFSSDGERFAAGGAPGGVCVWHRRTGALLARLSEPTVWVLSDGKACLPLQFAVRDHFLVVGGRDLSVIETSGWNCVPIADFPVVALVPMPVRQQILIVGPEDEGTFPLECLALDSFTLSARPPVLHEHPTTTSLAPGAF